jgi:C-terminal processing protease CtpA/Prc
MLAGIGPLLGEGVCGYFVSADSKVTISYRDGAAFQGNQLRCRVSKQPYQTRHSKKTIIILTGPRTSSSGEIVTIAFKGKEDTYFYGQPTAGYTTANASYPLSDKSLLVLTVCLEADRNGNVYDGRIYPDQFVAPDKTYAYEDPARSAAMMWLQMQ